MYKLIVIVTNVLSHDSVNILPARVYMYVCVCISLWGQQLQQHTRTNALSLPLLLLLLTPKKEKLVSEQNSFLFIVFFFSVELLALPP